MITNAYYLSRRWWDSGSRSCCGSQLLCPDSPSCIVPSLFALSYHLWVATELRSSTHLYNLLRTIRFGPFLRVCCGYEDQNPMHPTATNYFEYFMDAGLCLGKRSGAVAMRWWSWASGSPDLLGLSYSALRHLSSNRLITELCASSLPHCTSDQVGESHSDRSTRKVEMDRDCLAWCCQSVLKRRLFRYYWQCYDVHSIFTTLSSWNYSFSLSMPAFISKANWWRLPSLLVGSLCSRMPMVQGLTPASSTAVDPRPFSISRCLDLFWRFFWQWTSWCWSVSQSRHFSSWMK